MRIYRAVIRGHFADLSDDAAGELRAKAADHHVLKSAFTTAGTLTYDDQLVAFNLRYELRVPDELAGSDIEAAALELAENRLANEGFGYKKLRVNVTDMATMWQ